MNNTTTEEHTHRERDGVTLHIMQYRDLAACGVYLPDTIKHDGPVGLGTGFRKCVACSVAR